jgi:hypothetical protein
MGAWTWVGVRGETQQKQATAMHGRGQKGMRARRTGRAPSLPVGTAFPPTHNPATRCAVRPLPRTRRRQHTLAPSVQKLTKKTPLPSLANHAGIPKFYRWLSERYPLVNQPVLGTHVPEVDNLYLVR